MLANLRRFYAKTHEARAIELLIDSSAYPALPPLQSRDLILQLYVIPSFQPIMSWSVYKDTKSSFTVRRVRWDVATDKGLSQAELELNEPTLYGADFVCPPQLVSSALDELSKLSVPAYSKLTGVGLDGVTYGFRSCTFLQSLEYSWWCEPKEGYEAIDEWYHRLMGEFEAALPAHTDRLRMSAIRH